MEILGYNEEFTNRINRLLADIQTSVESNVFDKKAALLQARLDKLATRYQKDTSLGEVRFKLYEAQALISYFSHDDEKCLRFLNEAVRIKGEEFDTSINLKAKLLPPTPVVQPKNKLDGVSGWFFLLVLGLVFSMILCTVGAFQVAATYGQLQPYFYQYPGVDSLLGFEITVNIAAAIAAAWIIYLIAKRKRLAKTALIIYLLLMVVAKFIDWSWAVGIFQNNSDALAAVNDTSDLGRSVLYALVWIPYLLASRRVAQTLTKG